LLDNTSTPPKEGTQPFEPPWIAEPQPASLQRWGRLEHAEIQVSVEQNVFRAITDEMGHDSRSFCGYIPVDHYTPSGQRCGGQRPPCMDRQDENISSTGKQARERKDHSGNKKVATIYHGTNTSVIFPSDTIQITSFVHS
jgi:hypothetical protein